MWLRYSFESRPQLWVTLPDAFRSAERMLSFGWLKKHSTLLRQTHCPGAQPFMGCAIFLGRFVLRGTLHNHSLQ